MRTEAELADDLLDADPDVRLRMPLQTAVILPPLKLLDDGLELRQVHDLGDDLGPADKRLADLGGVAVLVEAALSKLDGVTRLHVPVVEDDQGALLGPVLATAVFENRVHDPLRSCVAVTKSVIVPVAGPLASGVPAFAGGGGLLPVHRLAVFFEV